MISKEGLRAPEVGAAVSNRKGKGSIMTSVAQVSSNRKNARKSTGPNTEQGKARSSQNARKHGLYAQPPVVPGEEASAYREWLDEWQAHYQAAGPAASILIEQAAQASWRLRRCAKVEAANVSKKVRHAAAKFAREEQARAESLGKRLLATSVAHLRLQTPPLDMTDPANPSALQRELASFAEGADWLISRWKRLRATLEAAGKWDDYDRLTAVALLGKYAEDALDDPELTSLFVACHATVQPIRDVWGDFAHARAVGHGKPLAHERVDVLSGSSLTDPEAARGFLRRLATRELEQLAELKSNHLDSLAALDRDEAADRALVDDSKAGTALRRYESACAGEFHRALRDLNKLPAGNEPSAELYEDIEFTSNPQAPIPDDSPAPEVAGAECPGLPSVECRSVASSTPATREAENEPSAQPIAKSSVAPVQPMPRTRMVESLVGGVDTDLPCTIGSSLRLDGHSRGHLTTPLR
jgi:hypothetical protein